MPPLQRIVVGVDGSEASRHALLFAVDEGDVHRIPVLAVHAWTAPPPAVPALTAAPTDYTGLFGSVQEGAERMLANLVEDVLRDRAANVQVEQLAVEGAPASVLLDLARVGDLVVVASRGRGGFARLLLGSVSEQVARHAPCPVLIHRTH
jgi:nucleotide-binding universal stress UspA family protein